MSHKIKTNISLSTSFVGEGGRGIGGTPLSFTSFDSICVHTNFYNPRTLVLVLVIEVTQKHHPAQGFI